MRYSNNLNIMLKACEKGANYMLRDFFELGSLQSNSKTAKKFTNSSFQRVKKIITEDLIKFKPNFNYYFSDGDKIINDKNSQYHFVIFPINGLDNLQRANSDFVIAIALNYGVNFEESNPVAVVINKIIPNEVFYCEKGFGAFLNNKRIKISSKQKEDSILINNFDDFKSLNLQSQSTISARTYGSEILELTYLACNRLDLVSLGNASDSKLILPFALIAIEAGAKKIENYKENKIILANDSFLN